MVSCHEPIKLTKSNSLIQRFFQSSRSCHQAQSDRKFAQQTLFKGYLWKYQPESDEWRLRWAEICGPFLLWTHSCRRYRAKNIPTDFSNVPPPPAKPSFKGYIDLRGATLVDDASSQASLFSVSGSSSACSPDSFCSSADGSFYPLMNCSGGGTKVPFPGNAPTFMWYVQEATNLRHFFAVDDENDKEEWWKASLKEKRARSGSFLPPPNHRQSTPSDSSLISLHKQGSGRSLRGKEEVGAEKHLFPTIPREEIDYDCISVVGRGSYGHVLKVREKTNGNILVCKIFEKHIVMQRNYQKQVQRERYLLQKFKHPFIVDLHAAFQTRDKVFLFLEYLSGGDLLDHLSSQPNNAFSIDDSRFYAAQILLALEYLHSYDVLHGDLKAENCVLSRDGNVKLTDFGFATVVPKGKFLVNRQGTPAYMAPELVVIDPVKGYSLPVDMWAFGALFYAMVTGYFPFHGDSLSQTFKLICQAPLAFPPDCNPPQDVRDVLTSCIERNPQQRVTATRLKTHPFFYSVNWKDLIKGKLKPPLCPSKQHQSSQLHQLSMSSLSMSAPEPSGLSLDNNRLRYEDWVFCGLPFVRSDSIGSLCSVSSDMLVPDEESF